jgi:PAS domain S-box-containing protein
MTKTKNPPPGFTDLRRRAEELLPAEDIPAQELSPAAAARLIHELKVHQIELEMQNEELRQSQARLEESRNKYADLYDFAPMGYLGLDELGRITEANLTAATLLGVERSRLLDHYFWLFLVEADRQTFNRMMQNVQNLPQRRGEFHFQVGQGEARTMLLNVLFSRDEQGNGLRRLSLTDVTELEQAQQALRASQAKLHRLNQRLEEKVKERTHELEQATQELESFSYTVAHDLKTPLRAIEGFSRMLQGEHTVGLDEEGLRLLRVVVDNTQLMRVLIDDLLNLAKMACQQMRKVSLNLTDMAQGAFARLKSQEPERDIRLIVHETPPAKGDYSLLYQVILNLLQNAFKFTGDKETAVIEVGGRSAEKENIYYVKDNGVGFNKDEAHKLFLVFQRLHTDEKYEGTGVGLATVQRIIQRHGGRVWADGKVGEGATIYFALPKRDEEAAE